MNSFVVALVGMVVVFFALALIILCIRLYSGIIVKTRNGKDSAQKGIEKKETAETTVPVQNSSEMSLELIAVITAAVAACMQDSGTGIRVRSIKRIGHTTPIWNVAGRNEYIFSKL